MELHVVQLNAWYKNTAANVEASIRKADADVYCIQELTQDSKTNPGIDIPALIQSIGYHAFYEPTLDKHGTKMGNGIFVKNKFHVFDQWKTDVQDEDPDSPEEFIEKRSYLELVFGHDVNNAFTVATTHLSPPEKAGLIIPGAKELEDQKFYDAVQRKRNCARFILGADLNVKPDYQLVKQLERDFKAAHPGLSRPTWKFVLAPDGTNAYDKGLPKKRIDYMYASQDLYVVSTKRIKVKGSDHWGISTIFRRDDLELAA